MSLIVQLFEKCLSPNNQIRQTGEQELFNYSAQNFYKALSDCCSIIVNNESPMNIRQFSGTFIKYIFSNDIYTSQWNKLSLEQIEFIKNNLMGSLASEKQEIRQASSLAIAALAKIELPKGWNVIEVLSNTSHHENNNYRITSLITFKNIVDFMKSNLKQEDINTILCSFMDNMDLKLNQSVIYQATYEFQYIIPYIENNFKNEKQREYIINSLNDLLNMNYIQQVALNETIQKCILIDFIEILRHYTKYIQKSFNKIAETTFRYFHCNNEGLAALSVEIWSTLCDGELELKTNFITSNYQDTLAQSLIRIFQEREKNLLDGEDTLNLTKASMILISCLAQVGNKNLVDRMLSYISECLNNEIMKKADINFQNMTKEEKINALFIKQNAFLIYRGVLSYEKIDSEIIMSSLQKIILELKNINSLPIGESIAYCLLYICKYHFNLINEEKKIFEEFLEQILQLLEMHIDNKKIELIFLYVIKYIIMKGNPQYFDKYLTIIINTLMKIAYSKNSYNKDCNLALYSLYLTGKIIENCENTDENIKIIQMFFSKLYSLFQESLNKNNFNTQEEQNNYQNGIISIITSCSIFKKITMNALQITSVYKLIEQSIIQRNELFQEALCCLGSLANFGWELFSNINDQVMNYVLISLDDKRDFTLCFQGIIAASDIIMSSGRENIIIIPKLMDKVQKIINDPDIPRGLKIKCFMLYTDIFILSDSSIGEYLPDVMQLIVDGMNSSMDPPNKDMDIDTREYLGEFREKICELLTGIFLFLTEHNQANVFSQYIDGFIKYISKIVEPEYNPSMSLIAEVAGLLGDFYKFFKGSMNLYLNKNSLNIIFQKLEESKDPEHKEILLYIQQTFSDFYSNY